MDRGRGGGRGRATKKRATLPSHHQFSEQAATNSATPASYTNNHNSSSSSNNNNNNNNNNYSNSNNISSSSNSNNSSSSNNNNHINTASHRGGRVRPANPAPHRPSSPAADAFRVIPKGADRPARTNTFHSSFIFESPSASNVTMADLPPHSARKRAKTFETISSGFDGADDEAHSKGGHSLRKRTRIDYTQMIDDELGLAAARNEHLSQKAAVQPAPRSSRKRKGALSQYDSDEDLDDANANSNSNPKRRRPDREHGHARANSRRRNTARKSMSAVDRSSYINQSDNDTVHDTIMVGVSMDVAVTDEESDRSSFQESESPSASPEGKAQQLQQSSSSSSQHQPPQVQPPSPLSYSSHPIAKSQEQAIQTNHSSNSYESAAEQPNEPNGVSKAILPDAPTHPDDQVRQHAHEETPIKTSHSPEPIHVEDAPPVAPVSPEEPAEERLPTAPPTGTATEQQQILEQQHSPEKFHSEEVEPKVLPVQDKVLKVEAVNQDVDTAKNHNDAGVEIQADVSAKQEPEQQPSPEGVVETTTGLISQQEPEPRRETVREPTPVPQTDGTAEPKPTLEPSPPAKVAVEPALRAPKPVGPARFSQLEPIYASETPFASGLGLEPYEGEDQVLPGPYTEWVYPGDNGTPIQTPTPTPTPTPIPRDRGLVEVTWDVTQPLKEKQLFALHKQESSRRKALGLPAISLSEFFNECVRRHRAAKSQMPRSGAGQQPSESTATLTNGPQQATASGQETPRSSSQIPESQVPTAAPSPAPAEDETPEQETGEEMIERTPVKRHGPTAAEPVEVTRNYSHQYSFPKIRDPSAFTDLLENFEDMENDALYSTVAAAVETLHAYQQEYQELKKILDDEENAKRRQANDKTIVNWENRQNYDEPLPMRRHHDDPVKGPPPFEVRGARAPKPYIDDLVLEHQREEDRIMAQVYGFKHNNHATQVGRQNPEDQRWEMPETRLRERKRTEKGAELAEENVVEGKRARKPRYVSADQSKDPSRSGTPVLGPGASRRPRKTATISVVNGDARATPEIMLPPAETLPEPTPRKARAAAAAARARQLAEEREGTPMSLAADPEGTQVDEEDTTPQKLKPAQKRARGGANKAPTSVPASEGPNASTRGKGKAPTKTQQATEIPSSSFYNSNPSNSTDRPSTASSEGSSHTAETTETAYSLRDKPKRNFVLENDPELEPRPKRRIRTVAAVAPKTDAGPATQKVDDVNEGKRPKRVRKPAASAAPIELTPAPAPVSEPAPAPLPVPHPELAYPPPPMALHPLAPPPPAPVGGLKAPTIFFTNPVTAQTLAPAPPPPPGPFMHTFNTVASFPQSFPPPQADPPAIKKPITRIKVTNGFSSQGGQQGASSKNGGTTSDGRATNGAKKVSKVKASKPAAPSSNGLIDGKLPTLSQLAAEVPEKSYSEMSKSEKMSWSMRRRWASGEMQGAVEKRRTTLANKKAEKANTTPGDGQGSNPGSGASTPQPQSGVLHPPPQEPPHVQQPQQQVMSLPNQGPLALPGPYGEQAYMGMQPPMQMQMQQPQVYGGHPGHPHGHAHAHSLPLPPPMQMVSAGPAGGQMVFQFPAQPVPPPPGHPHQALHPGQHY